MSMKNIKQIDIENKRILIRVDFNVPIINKEIQSDFRIKAVKETIEYCIKNNASIVLMSHLGRPKNKDPLLSLSILKDYLSDFFGVKVLVIRLIPKAHVNSVARQHPSMA